jgi:hypothetical protein
MKFLMKKKKIVALGDDLHLSNVFLDNSNPPNGHVHIFQSMFLMVVKAGCEWLGLLYAR